MTWDIIVIFCTLSFSAFFSGMEIAFVSSDKLKIQLDKKQGLLAGRIYSHFMQNPSRFIGAMLVGNNIALVVYGIAMAKLLEPLIVDWVQADVLVLLVQTTISTLIILVMAEFLPKTIFRINANWMMNILSIPVVIMYYLLFIPMIITIGLAQILLKTFFRLESSQAEPAFGRMDLENYLDRFTEVRPEDEQLDPEIQIFQNALDFSNVKARECMVPRIDTVAMDVDDDIDTLREKFIETGLSKILVYRDTVDNVIGYTHSYDLFKRPEAIKNILIPIAIVPESMAANEILEMFIKQRRNIAVVVDEYGGTSGMLTIEDVIEEIFGEIQDEHDTDELLEEQQTDKDFTLSARLEVDYLNEKYDLNLPESEDYETVGGLIIHEQQSIPEVEQVITVDRFQFTVRKVNENRIEEVQLHILPIEG